MIGSKALSESPQNNDANNRESEGFPTRSLLEVSQVSLALPTGIAGTFLSGISTLYPGSKLCGYLAIAKKKVLEREKSHITVTVCRLAEHFEAESRLITFTN